MNRFNPKRDSFKAQRRQDFEVGIRWWPAVVVIVLTTAALIWNFALRGLAAASDEAGGLAQTLFGPVSRQERMLAGFAILFLSMVGLTGWLAFLSRMPIRFRGLIIAGVTVIIVFLAAMVRVEGVTGDLVPRITWRWAPTAEQLLDPDKPQANVPGQITGIGAPKGARDWPQFLGSDTREPIAADVRLSPDWRKVPPKVRWRRAVGPAWSAFAVAGGRAVTQEQRGEQEMVTCYELVSGRPLWVYGHEARYETTIAGIGPRTTPTIHNGRVYAQGATGVLVCLDLETGKLLWQRHTLKDTQTTELMEWGLAGSPLIVENLVIAYPGGNPDKALIAYHADTGQIAWTAASGAGSYSSPRLAIILGKPQILIVNQKTVSAHDPADGWQFWRVDWPGGHPKVAVPLVIDDNKVFVSSGYGVGCALFEISRETDGPYTVTRRYKQTTIKAKFTNIVHTGGHVYGLDDGVLTCVEIESGRRMWKGGRYGHGQLILANDLLIVTCETGEIALVEANPTGHVELSRFTAFDDKLWNPPALAGRYLLVRTASQAACYELPEE